MKIRPIINLPNYNFSASTSECRKRVLSFGMMNNDYSEFDVNLNFNWEDMYVPQKPYSPQRQAIENYYGKMMAELADSVEREEISPIEYQIRLKELKQEKLDKIKKLR